MGEKRYVFQTWAAVGAVCCTVLSSACVIMYYDILSRMSEGSYKMHNVELDLFKFLKEEEKDNYNNRQKGWNISAEFIEKFSYKASYTMVVVHTIQLLLSLFLFMKTKQMEKKYCQRWIWFNFLLVLSEIVYTVVNANLDKEVLETIVLLVEIGVKIVALIFVDLYVAELKARPKHYLE